MPCPRCGFPFANDEDDCVICSLTRVTREDASDEPIFFGAPFSIRIPVFSGVIPLSSPRDKIDGLYHEIKEDGNDFTILLFAPIKLDFDIFFIQDRPFLKVTDKKNDREDTIALPFCIEPIIKDRKKLKNGFYEIKIPRQGM